MKVIVDRVIILLVYTLTLTSLNAYMREGSAYPMSGVLLKTSLQNMNDVVLVELYAISFLNGVTHLNVAGISFKSF